MLNRLFLVLSLTLCINSFYAQELTWLVQHPITKKWLHFGSKGSVQEAFIAAKLMPDPFVGLNELKFNWFENYTWKLKSDIVLSADQLAKSFVDLDFPSVDTYAKIYVNDSLVANTENAFVHYRFDVKRFLKLGLNSIVVVFTPPVMYQKDKLKQVGTVLPAPNDVGKIQVAPHCRKPQYQFGWDWSLRMVTMGFWEPVNLIAYNSNRLISKQVRTIELSREKAIQLYRFEFAQPVSGNYILKSSLRTTVLGRKNGKNVLEFEIPIENPVLWWPRGQGKQHLYYDEIKVLDEDANCLLETTLTFGLKTVELVQEKDQWGTSFLLKVNGRPIFCKGSDYIPDDIFPARITDSLLRSRVQTIADCNFNMIRIWGGGMYPKEVFLEECDKQGIMVWQDFMFACAMYPGTDAFLKNVSNEINQQIPRLSSHASLVYFNGNNEVDVAWHNWGFQNTYKLSKSDERLIESYYKKLFLELIPNSVQQYTDLPYVHTSPLSNWGKDEYFKHGTQHYWGVWHGKDPIEDFSRKSGRFNAEYGFQSFPEFSTLSSFSDSSMWALNSQVMKHHQKSYVGNSMIAKHANILFGETVNFKRFVYYGQLTQAKAVGMAVSSHRSTFPRTTGTLYWQMNDCWPAPSWSSLDYYGSWKALQYQVQADFRESAIVERIDTLNKEKYWFVQGNYAGFLLQTEAIIYDENGIVVDTFKCNRAVIGPTSFELFQQEFAALDLPFYLVKFSWNTYEGEKVSRIFVHDQNNSRAPKASKPTLSRMNYNPETRRGKFKLTTADVLIDLWLTHPNQQVIFKSNFQTLLPGTYEFEFYAPQIFNITDLLLFYR